MVTKNEKLLIIGVFYFILFFLNFIFKLYITVLVLPNIKMNPPQVQNSSSEGLKEKTAYCTSKTQAGFSKLEMKSLR